MGKQEWYLEYEIHVNRPGCLATLLRCSVCCPLTS
ncbi:hypothetical protein LR69_03111 [Geobacillus sp. BCO2]|nr:hypothetical protein LR69_03111 [Geobacillus sp. BCO2]